MKFLFISVATLMYVGQMVYLIHTGDKAGALIMGGYIIANFGVMWSLQ